MKNLSFTIQIKASAAKVYDAMLGITNKNTYEYWTSAFNPTSTYEGSWDKGSKIYFVGQDENGKKGGMVSRIIENIPTEFVSIQHYGFLVGDTEITSGEQVEKWTGGHENYSFYEQNGITTVLVEIDTIEDYQEFFQTNYPKALDKLKEIAEK